MKISYYPGCTLKTKAKNLEISALECIKTLGVECEELPRWNCGGASGAGTGRKGYHRH
ncbi:MAG: heterodisulfide reductase-related iron-sulfur binding cluster [candidate division Zixibacteria bacterium]|nr:heterodisulfide reductase-related iron-sulfur binding cluster [candidate division Zixibacteria bacterium]